MGYPQQLSERVFLLGNHYLSTYLIRGDRFCVLIEPGVSATAKQVLRQIQELKIDPAEVGKLIITHAHADHLTGAPVLQKALPEVVVSGSADTQRLLEKEKVRDLFLKDDADICGRLKIIGMVVEPENVGDGLKGLIAATLAPGQVLDLGGAALEVIDAPGHCIGGLALWEPGERILFCSDYLGFFLPDIGFVPNFYVNLTDYLATFESLAKLGPHWVCPGHCGVYAGKDARSFIDRARGEIEWITERVVGGGESFGSENEALPQELFERYYRGEATLFSEPSTHYCLQLLVRRILEAKDRPG